MSEQGFTRGVLLTSVYSYLLPESHEKVALIYFIAFLLWQ